MSEYVGIKAGVLHEHTELSEYYCARCGYPVTDHDSYCRECGVALQWSFATEPCARDALLKIADELDKDAEDIISSAQNAQFTGSGPKMEEARHEAYQLHRIAHRIKEALGVSDE